MCTNREEALSFLEMSTTITYQHIFGSQTIDRDLGQVTNSSIQRVTANVNKSAKA